MRVLKFFAALSAILLMLSLTTCSYYSLRGPHESGLSLFNPQPRAFDYWDYLPRFGYRHSPRFFTYEGFPHYEFYYPAPAIFVLAPFYHFDPPSPFTSTANVPHDRYHFQGYRLYVLLTGSLFLTMSAMVAAALRRRGIPALDVAVVVAGTALTAYPLLFALQRGNIEALTWMFSAVAVWALATNRRSTAAVLVGVAGAVKIYPLVLAGLFLRQRNWRALFLTLAVWLAVTMAGLLYLDPSLRESATFVMAGIHDWTKDMSLVFSSQFDHSAFSLVKWLNLGSQPRYDHELSLYYPIAAVGSLILFAGALRQPFANQVLFLCCAAVTLPPASYDYTLCLLYVPLTVLALGITAKHAPRPAGLHFVVLSLFALVLSPDFFLNFHGLHGNPGALKALSLILLMIISAVTPLLEDASGSSLTPSPQLDHHGGPLPVSASYPAS